MFGQPSESVEALGERIAQLYKELSYPSAAKFRAALTRRGIDVPESFVKQITSDKAPGSFTRRRHGLLAKSQ